MVIERTETETIIRIPNAMLNLPQVQNFVNFMVLDKKQPARKEGPTTFLQAEPPAKIFEKLFQKWKAEAGFFSNSTALTSHPAYKSIIKMGEPAIPFILMKLENDPQHLFYALFKITGENPVPLGHAGNLEKMTADWLGWGRTKGYLN